MPFISYRFLIGGLAISSFASIRVQWIPPRVSSGIQRITELAETRRGTRWTGAEDS